MVLQIKFEFHCSQDFSSTLHRKIGQMHISPIKATNFIKSSKIRAHTNKISAFNTIYYHHCWARSDGLLAAGNLFGLFYTCFDISNWSLVYNSHGWHDTSSSISMAIATPAPTLQYFTAKHRSHSCHWEVSRIFHCMSCDLNLEPGMHTGSVAWHIEIESQRNRLI